MALQGSRWGTSKQDSRLEVINVIRVRFIAQLRGCCKLLSNWLPICVDRSLERMIKSPGHGNGTRKMFGLFRK